MIGFTASSIFFTVIHNVKIREKYPPVKQLYYFCSYPTGSTQIKYDMDPSEIFE
jgi:hypothetical protein